MKRGLKTAAVTLAEKCLCGRLPARRVVLCYHSIHPTKSFASATPEIFELQLAWLKATCDIVPFAEFIGPSGCNGAPRHRVAITFDDGYADNHEYAFPLLQKYGTPATFFLTAGLVENDPDVLERFRLLRQCSYDDIRPLGWPQIREMSAAGMEFGAHTYSHPNLAALDKWESYTEMRQSKAIVENRIGLPVLLLAYPFGKPGRHFTAETVDLAARVGYAGAAAVLFRGVLPTDSKFAIPRFFITRGDDLETLRQKITGAWDIVGSWQENAPKWAARVISPGDFTIPHAGTSLCRPECPGMVCR